jgi:hypothetical protein
LFEQFPVEIVTVLWNNRVDMDKSVVVQGNKYRINLSDAREPAAYREFVRQTCSLLAISYGAVGPVGGMRFGSLGDRFEVAFPGSHEDPVWC